jgi:hypothetical protein
MTPNLRHILGRILQGIALAIVLGAGAGFGSQILTKNGGFMFAHGMQPGTPSNVLVLAFFGVILFLPEEAIVALLWVLATAVPVKGRTLFRDGSFRWYYVITAYIIGVLYGLFLGVSRLGPEIKL